MKWNYRVVIHESNGVESYTIHEVYYDNKGKITAWTEEPVTFVGIPARPTMRTTMILNDTWRHPPLRMKDGELHPL